MSPSEFSVLTRVISGDGCVAARLRDEARALGAPILAVVADRGLSEAGLLPAVLEHLHDVPHRVCGLIAENPTVEVAEHAALAALDAGAGAVLAVGGGSALGAAKAVAIRLTNDGDLHDWEGRDQVANSPAPSIAIPTTAGSGGEVSNALVLHDPHQERHVVVRGAGCEPDVALLDGQMLQSLPQRPMIYASLDALSHALEALWARAASPFTDALALDAAATIVHSLEPALERRRDAMQRLIEASAMANLACGNAGLTVVHALSSSAAVSLPHGYQNGVLLPHCARFNRAVVRRGEALVYIDGLEQLYDRIGFPTRFADGELGPGLAERMVAAAASNPFCANNLRPVSEPDLIQLLVAAGAHLTCDPARSTP